MEIRGIDVSEFNGNIDWTKVKKAGCKFALIRGGYGKYNVDKCFTWNIDGCEENDIPYGVYWFSYAYTEYMAQKEADAVADLLVNREPLYPIYFDFEEDSINYARKNGVAVDGKLLREMAVAFIERLKEYGLTGGIYTNPDFINRGYKEILNKGYPIWLAHPYEKEPSYPCGIWQFSWKGKVDGINGNVDLNICYEDYPAIIGKDPDEDEYDGFYRIWEKAKDEYYALALDIIDGKYGNGAYRKKRILEMGKDYDLVQNVVTEILK